MKIKCSKCRKIIYDSRDNTVRFTIYREWDIKLDTEFTVAPKVVLEPKGEYLMCCVCGHRVSLDKLPKKVVELLKKVERGEL